MRKLLFVLSMFTIFFSCKKNEDISSGNSGKYSDYLPMSNGNYWVYQEYHILPDGVEEPRQILDSVFIDKDTVIGGNKYFLFKNVSSDGFGQFEEGFYRDSSGYLLLYSEERNNIAFSDDNFIDTLYRKCFNDSVCLLTLKMEKLNNSLTFPAGSYNNVLNSKRTIIPFPKVGKFEPRYNNYYYAKNIGLVSYSYFYLSDPSRFEARLLRYKIN